jgi:hypothetical protein
MAITHANFLTQVRNYTEVDSNVLSDTLIDQFIRNTELDIASKVDYDDLRKYATTSTISSQRYLSMPSDLIYLRSVQIINSGVRDFLEKRDTSFMSEYYDTPATQSGFPKYYGNWDAEFWVVAPTPDSTYEITLAYVKQPVSITNTTQPSAAPAATNGTYVSNKYQDLLLYGCLVEAYGYLKGPADMLQYYMQAYQKALQSYAIEQQGRRRRDEYQDGVIRTPLKSPSP